MCQNTRKFSVQFPPETEDSVRNTEQLKKRWEGRTLFPSSLPPEQEEHNIPCMVCLPSLFPPEPNKPTTLIWIAVCVYVLIVNCSLFILLNDIQLIYYPCLTFPRSPYSYFIEEETKADRRSVLPKYTACQQQSQSKIYGMFGFNKGRVVFLFIGRILIPA